MVLGAYSVLSIGVCLGVTYAAKKGWNRLTERKEGNSNKRKEAKMGIGVILIFGLVIGEIATLVKVRNQNKRINELEKKVGDKK